MAEPEPRDLERQAPIDEASLRRARARDPDAMEKLFELYFDRVYDYIRRMLREVSDADDALQETFLRLSRNLDQLDPTRDPTGFIFRIASNAVRDHWRVRNRGARRLETPFDSAWATTPAAEIEDAHARLERKEVEELIQRALRRLSPADREIVLLRSYEGLETPEIADVLDIAPNAVRQRHSRAVRRLGSIYAELSREERTSS